MRSLSDVMIAKLGVVFDKDGTLVDLDTRWTPAFTALVDRVAARCDDPSLVADLKQSLGIEGQRLVPDSPAAVDTVEQITARVVAELTGRGHDAAAANDIVRAIVSDIGSALGPTAPIGDLAASLTALCDAGLRVGVATSDDRANTVAELTELGIIDLVDTLRCADDGGPVKPDPAVLTSIASEWGHHVGELVFVGDSRNDMDTAHAAGCPFVARCDDGQAPTWTSDADAVVTSIDQLVARLVGR